VGVCWKTKQSLRHLIGKGTLTHASICLTSAGGHISAEEELAPISLGTRYFHKETTSGIDTYEDWLTTAVHENLKTLTVSKTALKDQLGLTADLFTKFVSEALSAGTLQAGTWTFKLHLDCIKTGDPSGAVLGLAVAEVLLRRNSTEIALFDTTIFYSSEFAQAEQTITGSCPQTAIQDGDRIVVNLKLTAYVNGPTTGPPTNSTTCTVNFYADTSTKNSRVIT